MKQKNPGHYEYGKVPKEQYRRRHGTYGVIKGKKLNENGHEEFSQFIGLMETKWFIYRIYREEQGVTNFTVRTELRDYFDTKKEAKNHLNKKIGDKVE